MQTLDETISVPTNKEYPPAVADLSASPADLPDRQAGRLEEMFKAGAHFGYSRSSRNPKMKRFLFGLRNNVEVFDLDKTGKKLDEAKEFIKGLGKEGKQILFAGTKPEIKDLVRKYAKEANAPFVTERWIGGTLTNFGEIKKRRDHMEELMQKRDSGELEKYTKKERLQISRKIARLRQFFSGLEQLKTLPSALVVIDTRKENISVVEAKKTSIPVVGIMNSDCDPDDANYPIPANDNSIASVEFFLKEIVESYKEGLEEREKEIKKEEEKKDEEKAGEGEKKENGGEEKEAA
ncbi:MAG: 30S ribosomal protein S2 [bacterium]|nr:30S ribosomal protein S2 [bacterium]